MNEILGPGSAPRDMHGLTAADRKYIADFNRAWIEEEKRRQANMAVRAKFRVNNIKEMGWGTEIVMTPVYSDKPDSENKAFWDATPNGALTMTIRNAAAAEYFRPNAEFYLDFTQAEQAPE